MMIKESVAAFQPLLAQLMHADDTVRKPAEEAYDQLDRSQKAIVLLETSRAAAVPADQRNMALVLLRRLLANDWEEFWPNWEESHRTEFKKEILDGINAETDAGVRKKLCDVAAEVARSLLGEDGTQSWTEILRFMFDCSSSSSEDLKDAALLIFASVPGIFGTQQTQYVPVIKQMLSTNLQSGVPQLQLAAVKAFVAFLCDNEDDATLIRSFQDQMAHVIHVASHHATTNDSEEGLSSLVDLAETVPKIFRSKLHEFATTCLRIMENRELSVAVRESALEALTTLCESSAPTMRKEGAKHIPDLVQHCLAMMVEIDDEDDDDWATKDDADDDDDSESISAIGEGAIDRIACALGGKAVLPSCMQYIPTMLANDDWKYRHAGLMALSAVGEGCQKQMEPQLPAIVGLVLPRLLDPVARVRYAACNAIGQMSSDFAPTLQKKLHSTVLPGLLTVLDDAGNARVQAHAAAAMVNFSEDCPKTILLPYADQIMAKLELVLQSSFNQFVSTGKKLVLEQIITTIASVADTLEATFANYYDRVMPCLKYILENAVQPELRLLRGKTIECISLIGLAVGQEKFIPDATYVMQLLLKAHTEAGTDQGVADDDPQLSYMISAWARMCKILGKQFEQYLPMVMPSVMKTASFKPEVAVLESEDAKDAQQEDWQFVNIGDQQTFGIRTSGLEDKATACQMLVCYAKELKEGFAPYVEEVTKLMVPMLRFYFHDGVRVAAAESLPFLLESAKNRGEDFVRQMWTFICPELLKAIESEPDNDALTELMYSLAKCIECLGIGCLTSDHFTELGRILNTYLEKHFEKQAARHAKRQEEDYDEEVERELVDEDDDDVFVLSKISDIIHALFGAYGATVLPFFDGLLSHFTHLMQHNQPSTDLQWGICIFDDVIEFAGALSANYQQIFLEPMMRALKSEHAEVRQASAYGFGVLAMNGTEIYAQACAAALPLLVAIVQNENARETEDNSVATENAIAAVAKILKYNSSMINQNEVVPLWLSWLPTWDDKEESAHIYGYFCDLIESNNPLVLGPNNENLPHLMAVIAEAFLKEAFEESPEVANRLIQLIRQVQISGRPLFDACVAQLNADQVVALENALNNA